MEVADEELEDLRGAPLPLGKRRRLPDEPGASLAERASVQLDVVHQSLVLARPSRAGDSQEMTTSHRIELHTEYMNIFFGRIHYVAAPCS